MVKNKDFCELVRQGLSQGEVKSLIIKLEMEGFEFISLRAIDFKNDRVVKLRTEGHVYPAHIKYNYPLESGVPIPLAFILRDVGKYYIKLVNLDKKFPEDYRSKLIEIILND